jgi:lipopolysaccharide transport system ATP-binding protein
MLPIIEINNLYKKYRYGLKQPYYSLRDSITNFVKSPLKQFPKKKSNGLKKDEFWALKDISFKVMPGEVIGIIGRNGAGKTTLLKILSRITPPTKGEITLRGRVASLLEVGTGFHSELTGRENVYLNGAILGMNRVEIDKKFNDIVGFADIGKFLDTPVKHYSSGMYVRLAFAIAAHLEPEILLVDEVLAVGDAAFQKKCLGKMGDVAKKGRTVLLVSHNLGVVRQICSRAIVLNEGKIAYEGLPYAAISHYLSFGQSFDRLQVNLTNHPNRLGGMKKILQKISTRNSKGKLTKNFTQFDNIFLEVEYDASGKCSLAGCGFIIYTTDGIRVGGGNTYMAFIPPHKIPKKGRIIFDIFPKQFTPGEYLVTVSVGSHQGVLEDKVENVLGFTVNQADIYGTGYLLTKEDGVTSLAFGAKISNYS